jgi:hypothetical protein
VSDEPIVEALRRFILSYAEHDPDCPAGEASGPAAIDPATCLCGLIPRMEELLAELERRLAQG